jgi:hypothetical protein
MVQSNIVLNFDSGMGLNRALDVGDIKGSSSMYNLKHLVWEDKCYVHTCLKPKSREFDAVLRGTSRVDITHHGTRVGIAWE